MTVAPLVQELTAPGGVSEASTEQGESLQMGLVTSVTRAPPISNQWVAWHTIQLQT